MSIHPNKKEIIARLKRAEGHLRKVIAMMEEDKPCMDIAQQLHAVSGAIGNAKVQFIETHIAGCFTGSVGKDCTCEAIRMLDDFKTLAKYLK